ncbi:Cullin-associated NEDD8-dissociated protein 1 [Entophlyctis luteolus]|nr:Cullin-associated NEDD8-dissociated protein 1 [Entophlyctis luteolus]
MSNAFATALLEKLNNADSDFRYMAMADLSNELQKENISFDDPAERKIVAAIIKGLDDKNGEVQNLAVKSLGPFVRKAREQNIFDVIDRLCAMLVQQSDVTKDIAAIGLKTVVLEIPSKANVPKNVVKRLSPKLLDLLANTNSVKIDLIDILSDVLNRFGSLLNEITDGDNQGVSLTLKIQDSLFPFLNDARPPIRKRTVAAFGNFAIHTQDEAFDALIKRAINEMNLKEDSHDYDRLKTFVALVGIVARSSSKRTGKYISSILPHLIRYMSVDDDELRESCLQAIDSFILRCPVEIATEIPSISKICVEYMTHDPNYSYDDDDEMDTDDADQDLEDDDDDEELVQFENWAQSDICLRDGFSDDEDVSWKVRRASVKTLSTIISTRTELVPFFFEDIAPSLVKRFKEREESVRIEILNAFVTLIRRVGAVSSGLGAKFKLNEDENPIVLLQKLVPRLSKTLVKELNGKSIQTRQTGFLLLTELVSVLPGGLNDCFGAFMPSIEASLHGGTSGESRKAPKYLNNLNLKVQVLDFLRVVFCSHDSSVFTKHYDQILPPLLASVTGKFYKVTSEALLVVVEVVKTIRPVPSGIPALQSMDVTVPLPSIPNASNYLVDIYHSVISRVKLNDLDVEVKGRSIVALATLFSHAADYLPPDEMKNVAWPLLVERMRNEVTRLTAVRAVKIITDSPLYGIGSLDISPILDSTMVPELASFLRKSNRPLRLSTLASLNSIVTKFGKKISPTNAVLVLNEVQNLVLDVDMNIFLSAVELAVAVMSVDDAALKESALSAAKGSVSKNLVQTCVDAPHLVGSGTAGLDALTDYWKTLVRIGGPSIFDETVALLLKPSKTSYAIAQSIATLIVETKSTAAIDAYVKDVQSATMMEEKSLLALYVIGVIGRTINLSTDYPELHVLLIDIFDSPSDDMKQAAAFALGNIALGNLDFYIPIIIQNLRETSKRRYIVFIALKEAISRSSIGKQASSPLGGIPAPSPLTPFAKDLWAILFESTEHAREEGTRTVIAECLGKLLVSNTQHYLPQLVAGLQSPASVVRATVVMAIRHTFTDVASTTELDETLIEAILPFLRLLEDPDLSVRHVALTTLNSAAHNKPYLISKSLPELLPLLYNETVPKSELIHTVVMGPFKHRVDDGLEARKSAFECMHTLLEKCLATIEIFGFLDRVTAGLADLEQEIKIMNHLILQRVAFLSPVALVSRLDGMVAPLKEAIGTTPKTNAVKQEIEKINELVRSAIRTVLLVAKAISGNLGGGFSSSDTASIGGGSCPAFDALYREIVAPGYSLSQVVASVSAEVDSQGVVGKAHFSQMDLS